VAGLEVRFAGQAGVADLRVVPRTQSLSRYAADSAKIGPSGG
jgi:hypothetical protein